MFSSAGSALLSVLTADRMMSREEREEKYKAARERIFGTEEESPSVDADETNSSRPSSSLKDKNGGPKGPRGPKGPGRKRPTPPFDNQIYGPPYQQGPQGPHQLAGWGMPQQQVPYGPMGTQGPPFAGQGQPPYPGPQVPAQVPGPMYGPNQPFQGVQNAGYVPYNMPPVSWVRDRIFRLNPLLTNPVLPDASATIPPPGEHRGWRLCSGISPAGVADTAAAAAVQRGPTPVPTTRTR
jgi:hypothetical protein